MKAGKTNAYDIFRSVYLFSKLVGYCPQTYKRSNKIYDLSGIAILIVLLILKFVLLWTNMDFKVFVSITNSSMMNYGIWLQVVTTLLLSIIFTFIGLQTHKYRWSLLESYQEIDEELVNVFHSNLLQEQMKKWLITMTSFGAVFLTSLVCATYYFLSTLPLSPETIFCIMLSCFISNISILTTDSQLNSNQIFILSRYNIINNVLLQLLFECPEMKKRNVIMEYNLLTQKEFQYTKYKNNFSSKNVLLRDQLEISTITKTENIWRKREDLKNQKKCMEELEKKRGRFSMPNILFDKKSYFTGYTFTKESTPAEIKRKLNQLLVLHDKLTDCVDHLNDMCGLQMQLVTLSIFVVWMSYQQEAANIANMNLLWMFIYVFTLIFNIFVGTVLVDRAKETALILHRVMCTISSTQVLEKLYQLSEMLYSRQPVLGCGLLVWDWKYISSLIGGVCMYLIILIQFYVSSKT
ncbi:hypothetical protein Bhyg_07232 [Pseudolycoriella hygida]|uniref:Gustatory receptor n=1 Tax=Pseudolycoriella hygida TaxID=35572 RepID=A0A9Q0S3S1_9DIPT|nr:hypothetical protein Bhyg_07232 [Pseudolycoriella hygida]